MILFQRIRRSFLAINLVILLMLFITFSFGTEPSFAATARKEPEVAIGKMGKMTGTPTKSQVQTNRDAEQLKDETIQGMDRSIGKSSDQPDQQNKEARASNQDMKNEAREALK
jgi:hypothetical protein